MCAPGVQRKSRDGQRERRYARFGVASRRCRASGRTGIGAAVDQDILPGDVAGVRRTKERAGRVEFVRGLNRFVGPGGPDLFGDLGGGIRISYAPHDLVEDICESRLLVVLVPDLGHTKCIATGDPRRSSFLLSLALFRVSCLQKLRDFHQFSAQALISNAEVEFEELTRLSLRNELTPILRFGG